MFTVLCGGEKRGRTHGDKNYIGVKKTATKIIPPRTATAARPKLFKKKGERKQRSRRGKK